MIEIMPAADHVLVLRITGKLTAADYDQLTEALNARLKHHQRIGMVVDATEFSGLTPAALGKDIRYAFAHLGEFDRFPRAAFITNKGWLRTLTKWGSVLVPRMEIRIFEPEQREAAESWVTELSDQAHEPALRAIHTTRDDTHAFVWNGRISSEDMTDFVNELKPAASSHDKLRLFGRIEHMGGMAAGAFTDSGLLSLKRALHDKVERYAIVGGPGWLKSNVGLIRSLAKIDIRHFEPAAEAEAWEWLEARPLDGDAQSAATLH